MEDEKPWEIYISSKREAEERGKSKSKPVPKTEPKSIPRPPALPSRPSNPNPSPFNTTQPDSDEALGAADKLRKRNKAIEALVKSSGLTK